MTLTTTLQPPNLRVFFASSVPRKGPVLVLPNGRNFVCGDAVKPFGNSKKESKMGRLTWELAWDKYPPPDNGGKLMFGIKTVVAAVTVATMIGSSAFAADVSLAPGKPAGVNKAQLQIGTGTLIVGIGAAAVITAVAITVSNQSNNNNSGAANTFASAATSATTP